MLCMKIWVIVKLCKTTSIVREFPIKLFQRFVMFECLNIELLSYKTCVLSMTIL